MVYERRRAGLASGTLVQVISLYLSPSAKLVLMNYISCWFWLSWKGCWSLRCGECRPAAPSEEQGELLCPRHEICLEMLGAEVERASSSSCLSSVHSTVTLLPGRGRGGFAVVCDWEGARTPEPSCPVCEHSVLAAHVQRLLFMFPRGFKSRLGRPHLFEVWCQSLTLGAAANATQCSRTSLSSWSVRLLILFTRVASSPEGCSFMVSVWFAFGLIDRLPKSKEVLGTHNSMWCSTFSLCAWMTCGGWQRQILSSWWVAHILEEADKVDSL